jgi:hypothetical protein
MAALGALPTPSTLAPDALRPAVQVGPFITCHAEEYDALRTGQAIGPEEHFVSGQTNDDLETQCSDYPERGSLVRQSPETCQLQIAGQDWISDTSRRQS